MEKPRSPAKTKDRTEGAEAGSTVCLPTRARRLQPTRNAPSHRPVRPKSLRPPRRAGANGRMGLWWWKTAIFSGCPPRFFLGLCCANLVWDSDWALRWMANEAGNRISSCSECVYKPSFRCLCCARSTEYSERKITDRSRGKAIVTRAHVCVFSNHSTTWDGIEGW